MKIYQTCHIADMDEGRGPMVPGPAFLNRQHAVEYIDAQTGVMGRRAKWSTESYGDWQVREIEVHEHSLIDAVKERERIKAAALKKLSALERNVLGLQGG